MPLPSDLGTLHACPGATRVQLLPRPRAKEGAAGTVSAWDRRSARTARRSRFASGRGRTCSPAKRSITSGLRAAAELASGDGHRLARLGPQNESIAAPAAEPSASSRERSIAAGGRAARTACGHTGLRRVESTKDGLPPLSSVSGAQDLLSKQPWHHSAEGPIGDIHGRQVMAVTPPPTRSTGCVWTRL